MLRVTKRLLIAASGILVVAACSPSPSGSSGGGDPFAALPPPEDKAALQALNATHIRLLRLSMRQCSVSGDFVLNSGNAQTSACVVGRLEDAVAIEDDPALSAFHKALPPHVRYNENRSSVDWQRIHRYTGEGVSP